MTTNPQTRSRLLAVAVVVLALVVGGLAGATLDRVVFRQAAQETQAGPQYELRPTDERGAWIRMRPMQRRGGSRPGGDTAAGSAPGGVPGLAPGRGHRPLDRLTRELDLSAEQRERIEILLDEQQERMRGLRRELRERRGIIVAETRAGILELLTPEQRARVQHADRAQARALGPMGRMLRQTNGDD